MKETLKKQIKKLENDIEWAQKRHLEGSEDISVFQNAMQIDPDRRAERLKDAEWAVKHYGPKLIQLRAELEKAQALLARLEEEAA